MIRLPGRNHLGLRAKLWIGFGGLLMILLTVSVLSIAELAYYGRIFERIFRENYDSVALCNAMQDALADLNSEASGLVREPAAASPEVIARWQQQFTDNIERQRRNCSLPGELQKSNAIAAEWEIYRGEYQEFMAARGADERREMFHSVLLPRMRRLRDAVQEVVHMNLANMVAVDGKGRETLAAVRNVLLVLATAGALLAILFVGFVGPTLLRPLSDLTRSARRIADGQLDVPVNAPPGRDEVGQLAAAFNVMAERLREFRRLDRERLVRTEKTTQMAIDSLPDAVTVLNAAGRVELTNRAASDMFELFPKPSHPNAATSSPTALPGWMAMLHQHVMQSGREFQPQGYKDALQVFRSGEERFYLPHAAPLIGDSGQVIGVTVILSDVTPLKLADELKSDLVSTVSHELKTPLTSIRMATHLLTEGAFGTLTEKQASLLETARDNSDRLYRILENLLGISRMESGRAPLQLERVAATQVLVNAVAGVRGLFEQKNVELKLPEVRPDLYVLADTGCVGSILSNLLSNAARHSPAGTTVRVGCERGGEFVTFSVADEGPGIDPEHQPYLFEKFYRVRREGTEEGAGLGLAIAREIVEAHGGRIYVRSEPGHGAIFSFTLRAPESTVLASAANGSSDRNGDVASALRI